MCVNHNFENAIFFLLDPLRFEEKRVVILKRFLLLDICTLRHKGPLQRRGKGFILKSINLI